jgi:hypothetical protein
MKSSIIKSLGGILLYLFLLVGSFYIVLDFFERRGIMLMATLWGCGFIVAFAMFVSRFIQFIKMLQKR